MPQKYPWPLRIATDHLGPFGCKKARETLISRAFCFSSEPICISSDYILAEGVIPIQHAIV